MRRPRRWILAPAQEPLPFSDGICGPDCIARLLARKGMVTDAEASDFLRPRLRNLSDPFLLPQMRVAVDRILRAIDKKERIVLYGDYDVDGVTSLALLNEMLCAYGNPPALFLPKATD